MRRMEQVRAGPPQLQRDRELLAEGIRAGRFRDGPEVLSQFRDDRGVLLPAQHHELGGGIQPCEVAQQVADVGADAEIPQFPGVDGDSHVNRILSQRPDRPFQRRIGGPTRRPPRPCCQPPGSCPFSLRYARRIGAHEGWCFS